jgi:hypothetical protein
VTVSIANYAEDKILDKVLRNTDFTVTGVYVKLHIGDPGEAGTGNPAAETTRKVATFSAASGGAATTSADVSWTAVSTTETYSHISLWDAVTAGNCLWVGPLAVAKAVTAGDTFTLPAGDIDVTLD